MALCKYYVNDNLSIYLEKTNKFNTFSFSFNFITSFQKEDLEKYILLQNLLKKETFNYNKEELSKVLLKNYDLSFSFYLNRYDDKMRFTFYITSLNPRYVDSLDYSFEEIFKLINEILFNPKIDKEKGEFDNDYFEKERRFLIQNISVYYQDKFSTSYNAFIDSLDENSDYKYYQMGSVENYLKLTNKEVYELYLKIVNSQILITGNLLEDDEDIRPLINKYFANKTFEGKLNYPSKLDYKKVKKEVFSKSEDNQGAILLTYSLPSKTFSKDYFSSFVLNYILGEDSASKLFKIVREREGLCYKVFSYYDNEVKLIFIYAELMSENIDKFINLTNEIILDIAKGKFSKKLIKEMKVNTINNLIINNDYLNNYLERETKLLLLKRDSSVAFLKNNYDNLTKEDIIKMAKKMKLISKSILESKKEN